jgi:hypothetical protein
MRDSGPADRVALHSGSGLRKLCPVAVNGAPRPSYRYSWWMLTMAVVAASRYRCSGDEHGRCKRHGPASCQRQAIDHQERLPYRANLCQ